MFGRSKDDRPWLTLRAARISGPDGAVQDVELSGEPADVHKALAVLIRGVGGGKPRTQEEA